MAIVQSFEKNESPFDSILHIDTDGSEFWYARELMPLLGYKMWQKFNGVIETAKDNLETVTEQASHHITPTDNLVKRAQGGGSKQLDYKLSRLACYHIALCCDSRGNDAVKLAKHYFAIKTREAETVIPQLSERLQLALIENDNLKMQVQISNNSRYILDKSEAIADMHGPGLLALIKGVPDAVVEVKEKVTETIVVENGRQVSFEGKSTAQMAKELGFKSGTQLESWLRKNKADHLICQGFRKVQAPYIPTENVGEIRKLWSKNKDRQLLIGE